MISLPLWLFVIMAALSLWAVLVLLLAPSMRWFLRRRINAVIHEASTRLNIELPSFKLTRRQVLVDRLFHDPRVQTAAEEYARESNRPLPEVRQQVDRYCHEIVPAFNAYLYFRVGYWIARKVAKSLYRVRLGFIDEPALARVAPKSTVVFVMNHRSNMDYVLVSFLAAERAALSYAVGEWARVWPLQTLIRAMGAYFVRRDSGDPLYRTVLQRYVQMATEAGVCQAMFPEGGLSTDGRLRKPKFGLLDYMVRHFRADAERDLVFIPVGVNYDRVLEDRTLLLRGRGRGGAADSAMPRGDGAAKASCADGSGGALREVGAAAGTRDGGSTVRRGNGAPRVGLGQTLLNTARFVSSNLWLMLTGRWHRFGYACVNFGAPLSMRAWVGEQALDFPAMDDATRRAAVQRLGEALMARIGEVVPVLPVALAAAVLRQDPERAWSELELKVAVAELARRLDALGAHLYVPRQDRDYAIAVGLRMLVLRHIVEEGEDGLFRPEPANLEVLAYYANSVAHLLERGDEAAGEAGAEPPGAVPAVACGEAPQGACGFPPPGAPGLPPHGAAPRGGVPD